MNPNLQPLTEHGPIATAKPELRLDPLDVDALPPCDGAELDYRTQLQSPAEAARRTAIELLRAAALLLVLGFGLRVTHLIFGGWWVSAGLLAAGIGACLIAIVTTHNRELRTEVFVLAPLLGLCGFLVHYPSQLPPILHVFCLSIPIVLLLVLALRVTGHHLHWMNAHPCLPRPIRYVVHYALCQWSPKLDYNVMLQRRQTTRLATSSFTSAAQKTIPRFLFRSPCIFHDYFSSRPVCLAAGIVVLTSITMLYHLYDPTPPTEPTTAQHLADTSPFPAILLTSSIILLLMVFLPLAWALGICEPEHGVVNGEGVSARRMWRSPSWRAPLRTWHAIVCYHMYNRHDTRAPGVFQSPYGPWWQRRILLFAALATTYWSTVPMTGYGFFPLALIPGVAHHVQVGCATPFPWERASRQQGSATVQRQDHVIRHPEGFLALVARRAVAFHMPGFILLPAMCLVSFTLPLVFAFVLVAFVSATMLNIGFILLEAPDAPCHDRALRSGPMWAACISRLRESPYETRDKWGATVRERDHALVGINLLRDYPVLMHRDIPRGHLHMTGDTGSGKSALGIANFCHQVIGLPNTSMVILDLKGDRALFNGVRIEAKRAGVPFKWFTNVANYATCGFNVFLQGHFARITQHQRTELLIKALGLDYGEGYGAAFFGAGHRHVLGEVLAARPGIASFRELDTYIREEFPASYKSLGITKKEFEEAAHLFTVVHSLASFDALNLVPATADSTHRQIATIDFADLVRTPQIFYFFLPVAIEQKSAREIARLALHSLLAAASERGSSKLETFGIVDEFAQVVDTALEVVLQQARAMGVSAVLANQSLAQLRNQATNLIPSVLANTRCRMIFSTSDPEQQDTLLKASGHTSYSFERWLRAAQAYLSGSTVAELCADGQSRPCTLSPWDSFPLDRATEQRLNRNDLIEVGSHPLRAIVHFTRQAGFTCYGGYPFPMQSEFHITSAEYRRRDVDLPNDEPGTLVQRVAPPNPQAPQRLAAQPTAAAAAPGRAKRHPRSDQSLIHGIDSL